MDANNKEFAAEFGLFHLSSALSAIGCGEPSQSQMVKWYWDNSSEWLASSQAEFDSIARAKLSFEWNTRAIKWGIQRTLPPGLRTWEKIADATGDAWARLFEQQECGGGRAAYVAGMSAGRDVVRDTEEIPVSQFGFEPKDGDSPFAPWDKLPSTYSGDFGHEVWRLLGEIEDEGRKKALLGYWDENPGEIAFLFSYLSRRRGKRQSRKDRDRASVIIRKLKNLAKGESDA